ncbi:MAG TPA: Crp/Fnr family transcriptional regulator [Syntrophomonadaceae bacterium]|nr:Crp/Fnr family transcriptional regulator [Syntrophomonadaceae bacterium]HQD91496.1 Crp/Fnr family transcriptional regulator [Syntrophomonadaceae bacterium]
MQENCCADSGCQCHSGRTCMAKVPIFSSLSPEEMSTIAEIITDKEYKKGESIYLSGDTGKRLYVINQGKVKIFRISEAGKEQIIRILYPGDFMGELSLFAHSPVNSSAEALEPTMVCVIDGDKLSQIMKEVPSIAIKIIEELSKRLLNAENLIESLGLHDVEQRVADTLLKMAEDQDEITLTITKKDLAAHMGMSQETLSRKLTQFQDMGWIKQVGRKTIQILDRKSLLDIANLD